MITFFTTPKPFLGHIGVIQRNAIESWKRVHPEAEVILFGDEEGAAEAARALQIRHVPDVKRNEHGTKYLSPIFDGAQDLAHHNCLCYINCDIILLSDFRAAAARVLDLGGRFLMAGQRWDTDITAPVDFYAADWEATVRRLALRSKSPAASAMDRLFRIFARPLLQEYSAVCHRTPRLGQLAGLVRASFRRARGGCDRRCSGRASEPRLCVPPGWRSRSVAGRGSPAELRAASGRAMLRDHGKRDAPSDPRGVCNRIIAIGQCKPNVRPRRFAARSGLGC